MSDHSTTDLRLTELLAALSVATDLGMGQPLEFAMQSCALALRLAEQLGFGERELRATYDQALLRYIGCNAETRMLAAVFGDELALRADLIHQDPRDPRYLGTLVRFIREANAGASPLRLAQAVVGGLTQTSRQLGEFFAGHCEVAGRLAERLGLDVATIGAIRQVYARWDGKGIPALAGEQIAPGMLVVSLAQDAAYAYRLGGAEAAVALAQQRKGTLYAPKHVEVFVRHAGALLAGLDAEASWAGVIALDPGRARLLSDEQLDAACAAIADFADIKAPFMLGHSPGVARLAELAARQAGLPAPDVAALRRAALLHDVGRVGVSAGIWCKPGPLGEREWERVRLHAYHTERILARPQALAQLGAIAERRNASRLRLFLSAVALLLLVASGFLVYAVDRQRAAQQAAAQANEARAAAERQTRAAEALFRLASGDPDQAALLTRAALITDTQTYEPIVNRALHRTLEDAPARQVLGTSADQLAGARWSQDARRVLTWSADKTARIWVTSMQLLAAELTNRVCLRFSDQDIQQAIPGWRGCGAELSAVQADLDQYNAFVGAP